MIQILEDNNQYNIYIGERYTTALINGVEFIRVEKNRTLVDNELPYHQIKTRLIKHKKI